MIIRELVSKITKAEGKKLQSHVGNVREVIKILSDMAYADVSVVDAILKNGKRRAKAKANRKK